MPKQNSTLEIPKTSQIKVAKDLIESSSLTIDFYIMLILSAAVVAMGLLIDNSAVIIGGMLITPLLTPILTLSLGVVVSDIKLIWRSIKILARSFLVIALISTVITVFFRLENYTFQIQTRLISDLPYLLIAFFSGLAATFAWSKKNLSAMLPGVAIAVSIVPPICVFGIGLAKLSADTMLSAIASFLLNLFGIILGGIIVFSLLKFYRTHRETVKALKKEIKQEEKKDGERKIAKKDITKEIKKEIKEEVKEVKKEVKKEIDKNKNNLNT